MMKIYSIFAILLTAFLDQLSKYLVVSHFHFSFWSEKLDTKITAFEKVTSFFNLVLVGNQGVSFSLFSSPSVSRKWFILAFTIIIVIGLFIWLWRSNQPIMMASLSFIIGGALGNIIDRYRLGAVIDFIDFHIYGWHWPAFNLADCFIFIGVVLLIWDSIKHPKGHTNA